MPRQGPGETLKAVHHQFRHPRRAGGQQDPFCCLGGSALQGCRQGLRRNAVEDDVGFSGGAHARELLGRQVRRAEHQPARNAVEFQQRERGAKLLAHREQHRSAAKRLECAAQYRAGREFLKGDRSQTAVKSAGGGAAR